MSHRSFANLQIVGQVGRERNCITDSRPSRAAGADFLRPIVDLLANGTIPPG
jgi:hypothetical protein